MKQFNDMPYDRRACFHSVCVFVEKGIIWISCVSVPIFCDISLQKGRFIKHEHIFLFSNNNMEQMYADDASKVKDEPLEPINLTDLNEFCKIKIFEHLNWSDLVNTAETSNQLKPYACDVIKRKYGKGQLFLACNRR